MTDLNVGSAERSNIPSMAHEDNAKQNESFLSNGFDAGDILAARNPAAAYRAFDPETRRIGGLNGAKTGAGPTTSAAELRMEWRR